MKNPIVFIFLLVVIIAPIELDAQTVSSQNSEKALLEKIDAASRAGDYKTASGLILSAIDNGMKDSSTYFTAAALLQLSGDKSRAIKYLDTAVLKGYGDIESWQSTVPMLGFEPHSHIEELFIQVKQNAGHSNTKPTTDNIDLHNLFLEDQSERVAAEKQGRIDFRSSGKIPPDFARGTPSDILQHDQVRRSKIEKLLQENKLITSNDFYEAALIFHHGIDTNDYKLAHELAQRALALDSSKARWLTAATLDRYLLATGKPQKYGTQLYQDRTSGRFKPYPVDPNTTDQERAEWDVPALKDATKTMEAFQNLQKQ